MVALSPGEGPPSPDRQLRRSWIRAPRCSSFGHTVVNADSPTGITRTQSTYWFHVEHPLGHARGSRCECGRGIRCYPIQLVPSLADVSACYPAVTGADRLVGEQCSTWNVDQGSSRIDRTVAASRMTVTHGSAPRWSGCGCGCGCAQRCRSQRIVRRESDVPRETSSRGAPASVDRRLHRGRRRCRAGSLTALEHMRAAWSLAVAAHRSPVAARHERLLDGSVSFEELARVGPAGLRTRPRSIPALAAPRSVAPWPIRLVTEMVAGLSSSCPGGVRRPSRTPSIRLRRLAVSLTTRRTPRRSEGAVVPGAGDGDLTTTPPRRERAWTNRSARLERV
jgi:hypothetical protein